MARTAPVRAIVVSVWFHAEARTVGNMATTELHYTTPGMDDGTARKVIDLLQQRLHTANDLQLTLKHAHWNVVGANFIAVHEMLDPHIDEVRLMADELAERISTLGGSPVGTPGALVKARTWDDYQIGRATTQQHLAAIDVVYQGVVAAFREVITALEDLDPVSQDMVIGQVAQLEKFHWFVRAHLEDQGGHLLTEGAKTEKSAAKRAK